MLNKRPYFCGVSLGCLLLLIAVIMAAHTQYNHHQAQVHRQQSVRVAHAVNELLDPCTNCHTPVNTQPGLIDVRYTLTTAPHILSQFAARSAPPDPLITQLINQGERMLALPDLSTPRAVRMVDEYVRITDHLSDPAHAASDQPDLWRAVWQIEDWLRTLENQAAPVQWTQQPTAPDQSGAAAHVHTGSPPVPHLAALDSRVSLGAIPCALDGVNTVLQFTLPPTTGLAVHRRGPPARGATLDSV